MQIKYLKQQILLNRQLLAQMYNYKADLKAAKRDYDEAENVCGEHACHNELKVASKGIATLVELQQALKEDVRQAMNNQRQSSEYRAREVHRLERHAIREAKYVASKAV